MTRRRGGDRMRDRRSRAQVVREWRLPRPEREAAAPERHSEARVAPQAWHWGDGSPPGGGVGSRSWPRRRRWSGGGWAKPPAPPHRGNRSSAIALLGDCRVDDRRVAEPDTGCE